MTPAAPQRRHAAALMPPTLPAPPSVRRPSVETGEPLCAFHLLVPEPQYPLYSEDGNYQYVSPTAPPPPLWPCETKFGGCEGAGPNFGFNTNAPQPKDTCDAMPMPVGFVTDLPVFTNRYINGAAYPSFCERTPGPGRSLSRPPLSNAT